MFDKWISIVFLSDLVSEETTTLQHLDMHLAQGEKLKFPTDSNPIVIDVPVITSHQIDTSQATPLQMEGNTIVNPPNDLLNLPSK